LEPAKQGALLPNFIPTVRNSDSGTIFTMEEN
jgi:hypothetical protein